MALTEVDICNLAQGKLGASSLLGSITSPASPEERAYARLFPIHKRIELRRRRWVFATREKRLAYFADDGFGEFKYRYKLPSDCLRPLRDDCTRWMIRSNELRDAGNGLIELIYIADVPVYEFDDHFVDVLASRLAYERAEKVTQSNTKKADALQMYKDAVAIAGQLNAFIVGPEDLSNSDRHSDWVTARL